MNTKLKEIIERATKQRAELVEKNEKQYEKWLIEKHREEEEHRQFQLNLATKWADENIYHMIEQAILRGATNIDIDATYDRPKNLNSNIKLKILAEVLNNIGGLTAKFEPAEIMTDYPSFDHIYITWKL